MTPEFVIEIGQRTIETTLLLAAPVLLFSLVAGLIVSLFQAATQINEATLTFLPKILAVTAALLIFFPWMLSLIIGFTSQILANIPNYVR
ncbi:MAG: flagellar biosynthesis protein FliQ [Candidatus Manganitrophaceae bacterium]